VVNRNQLLMRTVDVENLIGEDHAARGIWAMVEQLDMTPFETSIKAIEGHAGPVDPRVFPGSETAIKVTDQSHTERRNLAIVLCGRILSGPASLVRGSSRRITIMRFRPANIRVINRRFRCCLSPAPMRPQKIRPSPFEEG
jgi:hypothetical protein